MADAPLAPRPPRTPADAIPAAGPPADDSSVEASVFGALELADRVLSHLDLAGCRLEGTDLARSRWRRCTLHDCELTGCDLANGGLEKTGMRRVAIAGSRLTGFAAGQTPHWDLSLSQCQAELSVWRLARVERARFEGCRLARSDWVGAALTDVVFDGCDLSGCDFSQCRMRSVRFRGCRYDGIRGLDGLRGATVHADELLGLAPVMAQALGIAVLPIP